VKNVIPPIELSVVSDATGEEIIDERSSENLDEVTNAETGVEEKDSDLPRATNEHSVKAIDEEDSEDSHVDETRSDDLDGATEVETVEKDDADISSDQTNEENIGKTGTNEENIDETGTSEENIGTTIVEEESVSSDATKMLRIEEEDECRPVSDEILAKEDEADENTDEDEFR
jgi:hypothetical protein